MKVFGWDTEWKTRITIKLMQISNLLPSVQESGRTETKYYLHWGVGSNGWVIFLLATSFEWHVAHLS